jgi:hypothetical protein
MIDITKFAQLVSRDHGLAMIALALPDGTAHASVASAGVLSHPVTGIPVVGVVAGGGSRKLGHLRTHPRATVVLRAGWQWAVVEGPVDLAGPDDPLAGVNAELLRLLLREIVTAADGTHDDFDAYDQAMAAERPGATAWSCGCRRASLLPPRLCQAPRRTSAVAAARAGSA